MKKINLAILVLLAAFIQPALGRDKAGMMEVTTEQRETMAARHEKLASCLRSGKPMNDCHEEMMGVEDCPMMGMGKMHDKDKRKDSKKKTN